MTTEKIMPAEQPARTTPLPERPNFFPGQLVDFRDFNRLARQGETAVGLFCRSLFPGGGVVVDALESFAVTAQEGLAVRLAPGLAVLPDGDTVILDAARFVDLSPYANDGQAPVVVGLGKANVGVDPFVDPTDPAVEGFRAVRTLPELRFGTGRAPEGTIELFRVALPNGARSLRAATDAEGWSPNAIASDGEGTAVLDLRFRPTIVPQTYVPVPSERLVELRAALFALEKGGRAIERLYLAADPYRAADVLTQLHAEALSRPFQPLRVAYLAAEYADRLSRYLELLRTKLGAAGTKYAEDELLAVVRALAPYRVREIVPRYRALDGLVTAREALDRFVVFAEENYRKIGILEEALRDFRHRALKLEDRLLVAGYLFHRVDRIVPETGERFSVRAPTTQLRRVHAPMGDGSSHDEKGLFFAEGVLDLELDVPDASRHLCVVRREYVRRGPGRVSYELNGRPVGTADDASDGELRPNRWAHRSLVLPPELLVPGTNRLRLTVQPNDLEFGFFETATYQSDTVLAREALQ